MANDMKVFHDGVEIEYRESDNQWFFELRGRERKADSLKAAKEAIDKPEPKPKKKFEPIAGWMTERNMERRTELETCHGYIHCGQSML